VSSPAGSPAALVSVILPVYNGARFIADAIDSALSQTYAAVEIIVVDDGSSDDTPAILERFHRRPGFTVVRQANRGVSASRNRGLAMAGGPYVAFLDHDDIWETSYLERAVASLRVLDDSVAGVVAGWTRIDAAGRPLPGTQCLVRGRLDLHDFLVQNRCPLGAVVLRRSAALEVGGFDERLRAAEDWDLWLRLTVGGKSLVAVEECLWRYRLHDSNASGDPIRARDDALRTLSKIYAHPAVPSELQQLRPQAIGYTHLHASTDLYALSRVADGLADFDAAVRAWPDLLLEDETYYATICAEQPVGTKASPQGLDLERAAARLLQALARCSSAGGGTSDPQRQRRAYARASRALARLAYGQRRMPLARRHAAAALRNDVRLWFDWDTIGIVLKSFAGAAGVERLSRWKRRAAERNAR
jgi:hypothetical protein